MITVLRISGDGTVTRAMVDTAVRADGARWERLVDQAGLGFPPSYRPEPKQAVYEIRAGEQVAQVAEGDLVGPLRELVTAVFAEGADVG